MYDDKVIIIALIFMAVCNVFTLILKIIQLLG